MLGPGARAKSQGRRSALSVPYLARISPLTEQVDHWGCRCGPSAPIA